MPSHPLLEVKKLSKHFKGQVVLKEVSFTAQRGEVISILGPSGSGKSTLLRCINFLETPSGGEIRLDGQPITAQPGEKKRHQEKRILRLRKRVAMVFQQFNLWSHLTALENITEAPRRVLKQDKKEVLERAHHLLNKVGLFSHRDHYPAQLSGGQKQRVAIARALAMQPALILFDEPTSALDPELVQEVLQVIRQLAKEQMTMLIVSHEIQFSKAVSNKTLFLYQGVIEAGGPTKTVFAAKNSPRFKKFIVGL